MIGNARLNSWRLMGPCVRFFVPCMFVLFGCKSRNKKGEPDIGFSFYVMFLLSDQKLIFTPIIALNFCNG